jgi:hypothetical protein
VKRSTGPKQWEGELPGHLHEHGLPGAWQAWLACKAEKGETVTQTQGDVAISLFEQYGAKVSSTAIRQAIAAGWKGFRLDDQASGGEGVQTGPMRRVTGPFCTYCGVPNAPNKAGKCPHCLRAWVDGREANKKADAV